MNYYKSYCDANGVVYSVDMLRFSFSLNDTEYCSLRDYIYQTYENYDLIKTASAFKYHDLYNLHFCVLGLHLNTFQKSFEHSCFIEFNPNKVDMFLLLPFLKHIPRLVFKSFDLAIDLPLPRQYVHLVKDSRVYKRFVYDTHNANLTEYLGCSVSSGRVKLYNKTIESSLSYDLTRLELSSNSLDYDIIVKQLPSVISFAPLSDIKLCKTDYAILQLLYAVDNPQDYFSLLGREKRDKLKPFVHGSCPFSYTREVHEKIFEIISDFLIF